MTCFSYTYSPANICRENGYQLVGCGMKTCSSSVTDTNTTAAAAAATYGNAHLLHISSTIHKSLTFRYVWIVCTLWCVNPNTMKYSSCQDMYTWFSICCVLLWFDKSYFALILKGFTEVILYAPNQWETTLQCNVVSHWLRACREWPLVIPLAMRQPCAFV